MIFKNILRIALAFIILVTYLSLFCFTAEVNQITVKGFAPLGKSLAHAKEDALLDAQYRALENVLGVFVNSQTLVINNKLIKDEVYSNAIGYISDYKIINEGKEKESYWVEIKASVSSKPLIDTLKALGILREWTISLPSSEPVLDSKISDKFISAGYLVTSTDSFPIDIRIENKITGTSYNNLDVGEVGGVKLDLINCIVNVESKAIKANTGEIIASDVFRGAGNDLGNESSYNAALINVAEEIGTYMVNKITELAASITKSVLIEIRGIGLESINMLKDELKKTTGVRKITQKEFDNNTTKLEVDYLGKSEELTEKIEKLKTFKSSGLKVESIKTNKITITK